MKKLHFVDDFYKNRYMHNKYDVDLYPKYVNAEVLHGFCVRTWDYSSRLSIDDFIRLSKRLGFYTRKIDGVVNIRIFVYDRQCAESEYKLLLRALGSTFSMFEVRELVCGEKLTMQYDSIDWVIQSRLDYLREQVFNNKL